MLDRINLQEEGTETEKALTNGPSRPAISTAVAAAVLAVLNGCGSPDESEEEYTDEVSQELLANYPGLLMPASKTFNKTAGHRYTACLNPVYGDPNLYGHYTGYPTPANYQFKSNKPYGDDCIWFSASSSGPYYLGAFNFPLNFPGKADMWITDSLQQNVPSGFSKALVWPMPGKTATVNNYSEFNSPWGNAASGNSPFFPGETNYIHSGVDIAAPPGTVVKAACDGKVVKKGVLDGAYPPKWGYYTVQECTKNGTTISIAYDHLKDKGRPAVNDQAIAGITTMGTIYDLDVAGEGDHLHLAICKDASVNCNPQGGAVEKSSFPGKYINPWITTNPGLYK